MKYATLDKNNQPAAFYSEDTHGARMMPDPAFFGGKNSPMQQAPMISNPASKIPASAVSMPHATWQKHIDGVHQVYDAVAKSWSDYVPSTAEALATEKATVLATVNQDYQALLDANITVPLLKADFQANAASRTKIDACINRLTNGWNPPVGADQWLDAANAPHPMTLVNMNAIANAIATREADLFARFQYAKAAIAAATTIASVQKVVL